MSPGSPLNSDDQSVHWPPGLVWERLGGKTPRKLPECFQPHHEERNPRTQNNRKRPRGLSVPHNLERGPRLRGTTRPHGGHPRRLPTAAAVAVFSVRFLEISRAEQALSLGLLSTPCPTSKGEKQLAQKGNWVIVAPPAQAPVPRVRQGCVVDPTPELAVSLGSHHPTP